MGPVGLNGLNREPNVVPMIDILLVLLISAMLGLLPQWKAEVVLPQPASEPGPRVETANIVLSIGPGPTYAINRQPIPRDRLVPELAKVYEGRPEKILFIEPHMPGPFDVTFRTSRYMNSSPS